MSTFRLGIDYKPRGDQATAIDALVRGLKDGEQHQVLLGVTGSGKTFTMAKVIEKLNRPALVLAHNKTLAAQLYQEFKSYFPTNAVEYFVSYYDYYQPEAYVPATDTYIEKDAAINEHIDKMRHSTTRSLLERRDVIVVASVSCIYGIGSPKDYAGMLVLFHNQDAAATSSVQKGNKSRFRTPGRFSFQEESLLQFYRWLNKRYQEYAAQLRQEAAGETASARAGIPVPPHFASQEAEK